MEAIFNIVLPIFGIMLAGTLAGRFGLLGSASSEALNGFVYFVSLPALFFVSLARVELERVFDLPFIAAYCGGVLFTFLLAVATARWVFGLQAGALALNGMSAIFSNTGYMGLPLLLLLFGDAGLLPAVITTVLNGALIMGLIAILLELSAPRDAGMAVALGRALVGMVRSPLLLSATAGLVVAGFHLPLPVPLQTFCDILGAAAGPAALFAIGLFLAGTSLSHGLLEVSWLVLLKLLVQPAVTWILAFHVFTLDPVWAACAVVQASLPTGALVFVLAQRYGVYVLRSPAVIMLSTVVSVFTLSLLLLYLGF